MVRILEAGAAIAPERLWTWIRWLDGHAVYDEHVRRRLAELLGHGKPLRTLLLEYVLLTPCAENTWTAAHQLNELGLELSPSHEDVASLLRVASDRAGDAPIDIETCRDLFTLGATHEGPAAPVRRAAIEIAREDPVVRGALASRAEVGESDWESHSARTSRTRGGRAPTKLQTPSRQAVRETRQSRRRQCQHSSGTR